MQHLITLKYILVPIQWKSALITPIAKIHNPAEAADFRPISVTSILSRCIEKALVKQFFYPCMISGELSVALSNQFAYRPSGSTTAALVSLLHDVTTILEDEPYVRLVALDFSRAFDTLSHRTLSEKLAKTDIPDNIYNWLSNFLSLRKHRTKIGTDISKEKAFNSGVVQGSAIGPAAFIICTSGLQPSHKGNRLGKYADDCYLLIPASSCDSLSSELDHVSKWAADFNLKLNLNKTKELIIRSNRRADHTIPDPPSVLGVERSTTMLVLGVTLSSNLSMSAHISALCTASSSALFALQTLRRLGMTTPQISTVCRATLVAKLSYCSPAWRGFLSKADNDRLEAVMRRAQKWGLYASTGSTLAAVMDSSDRQLFNTVLTNPNHVLHKLLPPIVSHTHNLRPRSHNRSLPIKSTLISSNFLCRMLYKDIY